MESIKYRENGIGIEVDQEAVRAYVRQQLAGPSLVRTSAVPRLGEIWHEQGGVRAAEIRSAKGNYDLILPLSLDNKPIFFEEQEWGEYGKKIDGADDMRDGLANTKALLAAGNVLAKKLAGYNANSHIDCYWPAACELSSLYMNVPEH